MTFRSAITFRSAPVVDKEPVLFWTGPWEDAVVSDATGGKRSMGKGIPG